MNDYTHIDRIIDTQVTLLNGTDVQKETARASMQLGARIARSNWYDWHENLARFVSYMADEFTTSEEIARIIAKPWKWTKEWEELKATGRIKSIADPLGLESSDDVQLLIAGDDQQHKLAMNRIIDTNPAGLDRLLEDVTKSNDEEQGALLDVTQRPDRFESD